MSMPRTERVDSAPLRSNPGVTMCLFSTPWFAPAVVFTATLVIRLLVWDNRLVGWDEWILTTISSRVGLSWLPRGDWYDLLVPTGYSYPSFFFWLNGILIYLLGATPLIFRLVTVLSDAASAAMAAALGRRIGGHWTAWTAGLLASSYLYLSFHDTVTIDFLVSFWVLLSVRLFIAALDRNDRRLMLLSVFLGGLGCFTKYHGVVYFATLCTMVLVIPTTRNMLRRKKFVSFAAAALAFPCLLLALEGLTWHFYGFAKTHLAEVFRVLTWTSYVQDPFTGELTRPQWHYYLAYCWTQLGAVTCLLVLAGMAVALKRRTRDTMVLLAIVVVWMLWATFSELKNARYILPAVFLMLIFAGIPLRELARTGPIGRVVAAILLVWVTLAGFWATWLRIRDYLDTADRNGRVAQGVNTRTPPEAVVLAESVLFQATDPVGIEPIKRLVITPETPQWERRISYFISDEGAFEMLAKGVIPSQEGYVAERERIVEEWSVLLDIGTGKKRVRVLQRPDAVLSEP